MSEFLDNINVDGDITAEKHITVGGTSNDVVKGDGTLLPITNLSGDSNIKIIQINEDDLPPNFTLQDVNNYLNTITINKQIDEEYFWETKEYGYTFNILTPTEGQQFVDVTSVTMSIEILTL